MTEENSAIEPAKDDFLDTFADLRPDLFFPGDWSPEKKNRVEAEMRPRKVRTAMYSQIPMQCDGPHCPYAAVCPLMKTGDAPIGYSCPIEGAIVIEFAHNYQREFGVDENNLVEMSMVRDLVDLEVQFMRSKKILAQEHFIQENPVGVDPDGNVVVRKELHQAVEYDDKLLRRKEKILNAFLATREARTKAGQGVADASQQIANLLDSVRDHAAEKDRLVLEKMGVQVTDKYIEDMKRKKAEEKEPEGDE
jgi:hypothetical protein